MQDLYNDISSSDDEDDSDAKTNPTDKVIEQSPESKLKSEEDQKALDELYKDEK